MWNGKVIMFSAVNSSFRRVAVAALAGFGLGMAGLATAAPASAMSATDCTLYFDRLCLYTGTGFSGGGLVLTEIGGARSSCRALPGRMNDQTSSIINNSGRSITFFARGDCTDAVWALGPGQSVAELPAFANKTISAVIVR